MSPCWNLCKQINPLPTRFGGFFFAPILTLARFYDSSEGRESERARAGNLGKRENFRSKLDMLCPAYLLFWVLASVFKNKTKINFLKT